MSLPLYARRFANPNGAPLIILHGLLGSSRNWTHIGKKLSTCFDVFALDLRNHGRSPHHENSSFESLLADLRTFIQEHNLSEIHCMGHSLGGKVAMQLAVHHPEQLASIVVVDIIPKTYPKQQRHTIKTLMAMPLGKLQNHAAAEKWLAERLRGTLWRKFLLTNLKRDAEGQFYWQANLPALLEGTRHFCENPLEPENRYEGPSLLVAGENSEFVQAQDHKGFKAHFPKAATITLPECGHNPHTEAPEAFLESVRPFLEQHTRKH